MFSNDLGMLLASTQHDATEDTWVVYNRKMGLYCYVIGRNMNYVCFYPSINLLSKEELHAISSTCQPFYYDIRTCLDAEVVPAIEVCFVPYFYEYDQEENKVLKSSIKI